MRIALARTVVATGLLAFGLPLGGCYNDRPGRWGDRHHGWHHHHHHDHDYDHDRDWR